MSNKTNNLKAYLRDLYEGIVSKKPDASRNPQDFRSEIEAIRTGGELYEVMDASELPEDAPNGSLALVEGEPIPEAYTVSSVDELPSNAVDGSMAIVEGTREALANTEWMLDQYFESSGAKSEKVYPMKFSYIDEYGEIYTALGVSVKDRGDYIEFSYVHSPALGVFDDGWATDNAEEYRIITILEEPPKESAEWVMAHGIKQSGDTVYITTKSLYTHENGQWVYKCEVV